MREVKSNVLGTIGYVSRFRIIQATTLCLSAVMKIKVAFFPMPHDVKMPSHYATPLAVEPKLSHLWCSNLSTSTMLRSNLEMSASRAHSHAIGTPRGQRTQPLSSTLPSRGFPRPLHGASKMAVQLWHTMYPNASPTMYECEQG